MQRKLPILSVMHMKRTVIFFLLAVWALLVASCSRHRLVVNGFVDEPQDSILIDLSQYVFPDSRIEIKDVKKLDGYYYFRFGMTYRGDFEGPPSLLMAAAEDKLKAKHIPLPDDVNEVSSIFARNDTLILKSDDKRLFSFDPKKWKWSPVSSGKEDKSTLYEDDDWIVKSASHGEFGGASWFIDKHTQEEYAFVELKGRTHRIGNTFYVVTSTRIYEIPDPSFGFRCDSTTRYENAKDVRPMSYPFDKAGYIPMKHYITPRVRFDDPVLIDIDYIFPDGRRIYFNPYYVYSEDPIYRTESSDTTFVASFCASDTLFCVLDTPSGLELMKLGDAGLIPVHNFDMKIKDTYPFIFNFNYPSIIVRNRYRDESNPTDERLFLVINTEDGVSELIDLAHNGNTILRVRYFPSDLSDYF